MWMQLNKLPSNEDSTDLSSSDEQLLHAAEALEDELDCQDLTVMRAIAEVAEIELDSDCSFGAE